MSDLLCQYLKLTLNVIRLAEAGNDEAARRQFRVAGERLMAHAVVHHVFVHFVGEDQDLRAAHDVGQGGHVGRAQDGARRIVRCVDDDQARF